MLDFTQAFINLTHYFLPMHWVLWCCWLRDVTEDDLQNCAAEVHNGFPWHW